MYDYRLVRGLLRVLRKGGPARARARRLGAMDNLSEHGPIACANRLLASLGIPWAVREDESDVIVAGDVELTGEVHAHCGVCGGR